VEEKNEDKLQYNVIEKEDYLNDINLEDDE